MVQIHPSYDIWTDNFVLLNLDKQMPAGADLDLCEILLSSAELLPQNYPHLTTLYKAGGFYVSTSICSSLNTLLQLQAGIPGLGLRDVGR